MAEEFVTALLDADEERLRAKDLASTALEHVFPMGAAPTSSLRDGTIHTR